MSAGGRVSAGALHRNGVHRMIRLISRIVVLLSLIIAPAAFAAGDSGTPEEAKAMAMRAAALLKNDGPERLFPNSITAPIFTTAIFTSWSTTRPASAWRTAPTRR
jgi:hypothetical protein